MVEQGGSLYYTLFKLYKVEFGIRYQGGGIISLMYEMYEMYEIVTNREFLNHY